MSVYVDDAMIPWRGRLWCHLTADEIEELDAFAASLGLKREWYQPSRRPEACHYDVTPSVREAAIAAGAIAESVREGGERRRAAAARRRAAASPVEKA